MSTLTHTEFTRDTSGGTSGGRIISGPLALVFLSSFGTLTVHRRHGSTCRDPAAARAVALTGVLMLAALPAAWRERGGRAGR